MRLGLVLAGLGLLTAALTGCQDQEAEAPAAADSLFVAATEYGELRGFGRDGVITWRGVPYAAPPVGALRWRPPEPPESWEGTRSASAYGPSCPQWTGESGAIDETSEDCLSLNVTRPARGQDLPVMVWIHGGGFTSGAGSMPVFNSAPLVERGVVLVTLNYRLGRLGFFAHPALSAETPGEQIANFGLLDQVAALEWVRDNIAEFGGDPGAVTVFGESAGGMSVNALMSAPAAEGLFHGAISQSGLGRETSVSWRVAERQGIEAAAYLGLRRATAEQLREMPADEVGEVPLDPLRGDAPVLDDVLPRSVSATFEAGAEAQVPYIVGSNDIEVADSFFTAGGRDPDQIRDETLGADRPAALAAYGGEAELALRLMSDVVFTEPARHLARLHGRRAPAYLYRFEAIPPELKKVFGGAAHAMEIPYVFDQNGEEVAGAISDAWVAFAKTGDPGWDPVGDGTLVRFTNAGWKLTDQDPWRTRLDIIEARHQRSS